MRALSRLILRGLLFCPAAAFPFNISANIASIDMPVDAGHEEITRQALLLVAQSGVDYAKFLDPAAIDDITTGNYATDMPSGPYPLSINQYWGFPSGTDWNNPLGQDLHFLRDYVDANTLESAYAACRISRERIVRLSRDAASMRLAGKRRESLFLLGHATHIIQDSFSPAHTIRGAKDHNNDIQDICYYPDGSGPATPAAEVCFHQTVDPRDRIWLVKGDSAEIARTQQEWHDRGAGVAVVGDLSDFDLNDETEASRHEHLKHEARLAAAATAKYVHLILTNIRLREQDKNYDLDYHILADKLTKRLFEGGGEVREDIPGLGDIMPEGIMHCDGLSRDRIRLIRKSATSRISVPPEIPAPAW